MLDYTDFYVCRETINENTRGCFSPREIGEQAHNDIVAYENKDESYIKSLVEVIKENTLERTLCYVYEELVKVLPEKKYEFVCYNPGITNAFKQILMYEDIEYFVDNYGSVTFECSEYKYSDLLDTINGISGHILERGE